MFPSQCEKHGCLKCLGWGMDVGQCQEEGGSPAQSQSFSSQHFQFFFPEGGWSSSVPSPQSWEDLFPTREINHPPPLLFSCWFKVYIILFYVGWNGIEAHIHGVQWQTEDAEQQSLWETPVLLGQELETYGRYPHTEALQTLECWEHGYQSQTSRLRCFKRWSYKHFLQVC